MRRLIPRWRKMTWLIVVWNAAILAWIFSYAGESGQSVDECVADSGGFLTRQDCQDAVDTGTGIGVFLILILWFLVSMVLFAVWFATRPRDDKGAAALAEEMRLAREERASLAAASADGEGPRAEASGSPARSEPPREG